MIMEEHIIILMTLFISIPEYLNILEKITESLVKNSKYISSDFVFQISARQIVIKYLSHKYGVDIQSNATGYLCAAGDCVTVIENDGTITPCGTANNQRMSEKALKEKRYVLQKLSVFDYFTESELMQTPFFSTFRKYKNESKKAIQLVNRVNTMSLVKYVLSCMTRKSINVLRLVEDTICTSQQFLKVSFNLLMISFFPWGTT